jgi:DNA-binding CsgD family transcriptional regulator
MPDLPNHAIGVASFALQAEVPDAPVVGSLASVPVDEVPEKSHGGRFAARLSEFVGECAAASTPEQVFDIFKSAVGGFGYERVAFVPVTQTARQALGLADLAPAISANVPDEWVRHYFTNEYHIFDPILLQVPHEQGPLVWDDLQQRSALSVKQRRILAESREAGLLNGVSIPLHGPRGETYVVSLASEQTRIEGPAYLDEIHLFAIQFLLSHGRAARKRAVESCAVRITDRERECLTWTARGKSAWTIGKILGVSEHTVNFHLKQSMGKFGAINRMQAVVTAVRMGLILP